MRIRVLECPLPRAASENVAWADIPLN